ncbi:Gfo/Idh/MocA family oxidoreductase [Amylibacter sp.]|nr:Gfo/Idh/MocA family oxidoreductase [Amylibacter sp.]
MTKDKVLIIGGSNMAQSYYAALSVLNVDIEVVCRSNDTAVEFYNRTGKRPHVGGYQKYLSSNPSPDHVIVVTSVEDLSKVSLHLLDLGIKSILVEKPAGLFVHELESLCRKAEISRASVFVAYNRRFYSSVTKLLELAGEDGGITSLSFDFTEWSDSIETLSKGPYVKERWVLCNSTHVIDLAFFIAGKPARLDAYVGGKLNWHPAGSRYAGSGISEAGIFFNYRADWDAPGRWGLTGFTKNYKLELTPLEGLLLTERNSVKSESVKLDDFYDKEYKPGLFYQIKAFIEGDCKKLCTITEQLDNYLVYSKIAGYED